MAKYGFDKAIEASANSDSSFRSNDVATYAQRYRLAILGCRTFAEKGLTKSEASVMITKLVKKAEEAEPFASASQQQLITWMDSKHSGLVTGDIRETNAAHATNLIRTWLPRLDSDFALLCEQP